MAKKQNKIAKANPEEILLRKGYLGDSIFYWIIKVSKPERDAYNFLLARSDYEKIQDLEREDAELFITSVENDVDSPCMIYRLRAVAISDSAVIFDACRTTATSESLNEIAENAWEVLTKNVVSDIQYKKVICLEIFYDNVNGHMVCEITREK